MLIDRSFRNLIKLTLVSLIIFLLFFATSIVLDIKIKEKSYVSQKTVTGRGSAEIKAIPNVVSINFTIKKTKKTSDEAQKEMTKIIKSALRVLDKNGIEKKDIKTLDYSIRPKYEKVFSDCQELPCKDSKEVLVGYVATQSFTVKIREISKGSGIINQLNVAGVDEISGLDFIIDSIDEVKNNARLQAIINAKVEAQETAKALNVKLKRIVKYQDEENFYQPYAMQRLATATKTAELKGEGSQLFPSEEIVRSSVLVTYEFE
jgi:uncharacterized protein YggE